MRYLLNIFNLMFKNYCKIDIILIKGLEIVNVIDILMIIIQKSGIVFEVFIVFQVFFDILIFVSLCLIYVSMGMIGYNILN